MHTVGKIEDGDSPVDALRREPIEGIGLVLAAHDDARHPGRYSAPVANEPGHTVVLADFLQIKVPLLSLENRTEASTDPTGGAC